MSTNEQTEKMEIQAKDSLQAWKIAKAIYGKPLKFDSYLSYTYDEYVGHDYFSSGESHNDGFVIDYENRLEINLPDKPVITIKILDASQPEMTKKQLRERVNELEEQVQDLQRTVYQLNSENNQAKRIANENKTLRQFIQAMANVSEDVQKFSFAMSEMNQYIDLVKKKAEYYPVEDKNG